MLAAHRWLPLLLVKRSREGRWLSEHHNSKSSLDLWPPQKKEGKLTDAMPPRRKKNTEREDGGGGGTIISLSPRSADANTPSCGIFFSSWNHPGFIPPLFVSCHLLKLAAGKEARRELSRSPFSLEGSNVV